MKRIAITTGDVNGIGAEIVKKALNKLKLPKSQVVIITNPCIYGDTDYQIEEIAFSKDNIKYGECTKESGEFSFECLKKACELAIKGEVETIVTAPVAKEALHLAGHFFNGQTEVLEHFLARNEQKAEMLFVLDNLNVLLLTRHIALKDVSSSLTKEILEEKIERLNDFFVNKMRNVSPKFSLASINPHAGENGVIGDEEATMKDVVTELRNKGINVTNPIAADMLFAKVAEDFYKNKKQKYDCYIVPYHDQGLIPIKMLGWQKCVNMTIGLDIVRTSPAHGTGFDIAGKNVADETSMLYAIKKAIDI